MLLFGTAGVGGGSTRLHGRGPGRTARRPREGPPGLWAAPGRPGPGLAPPGRVRPSEQQLLKRWLTPWLPGNLLPGSPTVRRAPASGSSSELAEEAAGEGVPPQPWVTLSGGRPIALRSESPQLQAAPPPGLERVSQERLGGGHREGTGPWGFQMGVNTGRRAGGLGPAGRLNPCATAALGPEG